MQMNFQETVQYLQNAATQIREEIIGILEWMVEKLEAWNIIQPGLRSGRQFSFQTQEQIRQTAGLMARYFVHSPGESLLQEDLESRYLAITDFANDLLECLGLGGEDGARASMEQRYGTMYLVISDAELEAENREAFLRMEKLAGTEKEDLDKLVWLLVCEIYHLKQCRDIWMGEETGWNYKQETDGELVLHPDEGGMREYLAQPIAQDAHAFVNAVWEQMTDMSQAADTL